MAGYIVRRLLQAIPVFFGATFLIYFMVFAMPGDPIVALFGDRPPTPQVLEQLREQYHLDQPFIVQYCIYLGGIFPATSASRSRVSPSPRSSPAPSRSPLRLALIAIVIEIVFGIIVGLVAGLRKGRHLRRQLRSSSA